MMYIHTLLSTYCRIVPCTKLRDAVSEMRFIDMSTAVLPSLQSTDAPIYRSIDSSVGQRTTRVHQTGRIDAGSANIRGDHQV
jgi:hypothetical protein